MESVSGISWLFLCILQNCHLCQKELQRAFRHLFGVCVFCFFLFFFVFFLFLFFSFYFSTAFVSAWMGNHGKGEGRDSCYKDVGPRTNDCKPMNRHPVPKNTWIEIYQIETIYAFWLEYSVLMKSQGGTVLPTRLIFTNAPFTIE